MVTNREESGMQRGSLGIPQGSLSAYGRCHHSGNELGPPRLMHRQYHCPRLLSSADSSHTPDKSALDLHNFAALKPNIVVCQVCCHADNTGDLELYAGLYFPGRWAYFYVEWSLVRHSAAIATGDCQQ
jgi:hypothetical protein